MEELKTRNEFIERCLSLGFKKIDEPICKLKYVVAEADEDQEVEESIIVLRVENGHAAFVFSSGYSQEFIHLNSMDPEEVIAWSKLISHIEPNW